MSTESQAAPITLRPRSTTLGRFASALRRFLAELFSQPQSALGTLIVLAFLLLTLFGPLIAPYSENDQSHEPRLAPTSGYPFGTDFLGRDVFSRVVLGARSIFLTAGLGTIIAVTLGTLLGLFSAYQGGWMDEIISRLIDTFLALPALLITLVILGVIKDLEIEPNTWQARLANNSVLLVISLVYVPIVARVVRSVTLDIKTREFVQAAQTQGESRWYIMLREIFPSVIPALVVEASLRFSYGIFLVASLGFLGVGAKPPSPDWGLMVNENRSKYTLTPWALEYPALAIAILVIGLNLLSDGIRRVVQKGGS
jgi:peptide/nickel transport system permease protein